jgi:hypothetical protein
MWKVKIVYDVPVFGLGVKFAEKKKNSGEF